MKTAQAESLCHWNGEDIHHRDTEDTESWSIMEMDFVWVGLLNRWRFFRFYILRGLLSGDWGPTYRRDWPGECGAPGVKRRRKARSFDHPGRMALRMTSRAKATAAGITTETRPAVAFAFAKAIADSGEGELVHYGDGFCLGRIVGPVGIISF